MNERIISNDRENKMKMSRRKPILHWKVSLNYRTYFAATTALEEYLASTRAFDVTGNKLRVS